MDWYRMKTVLICLFLGINLFLAALLGYESYAEYKAAKAQTEAVVSTLSRNGITVSNAVRVRPYRLRSLTVENPYADKAAFADRVLGGGAAQMGAIYQQDGKSIRFTENGFVFTGNSNAVSPNKKSIGTMKKALSDMGLSMRYAKGHIEGDAIVFTQKIDKVPLFGSRLRVTVGENNQLAAIEGTWVNVLETPGEKQRTSLAAQALLTFLQEGTHEGETITAVECGYGILLSADGYRTATAVPAWRIETANGTDFLYDAR